MLRAAIEGVMRAVPDSTWTAQRCVAYSRSTSRGIERAVQRAGVGPLSFHGLRHGFASMLIVGLKADVETVSRQLGHANSSITLSVYSHEFDRARNADELRTALSGAFGHVLGASS